MKHFYALVILVFFSLLHSAHATVRNAATCSQADVATQIAASVDGDTVQIPSGTCAWTTGVSVSGKGIKINGSGGGRIIATTSGTLTVGTGSKSLTIQSGKSISGGDTLRISQTGDRTNWMQGTVTSYSGTSLVMNITSTGGSGTARRWLVSTQPTTVITHHSSSTLFALTGNSTSSVELSNLKIAAGTGTGNAISIATGTNGKPVLIHDLWIEQPSNNAIDISGNRGVISNISVDSTPFSMAALAIHHKAEGETTSWTSASTWGTADTNGDQNFYIEDSDFHAYLNATDWDDNARAVFRHNTLNNAGLGTHGADTSNYGVRHVEIYDNTGIFDGAGDGQTFNMNWWFYVRGGTFVLYNNVFPELSSQDYGTKDDINFTVMNLQRNAGPNPCWTSGYHVPRQAGFGRVTGSGTDGQGRTTDSITYVGDIEPIYIWGNKRSSGASAAALTNINKTDYGECGTQLTANYVRENTEYFNSASTAKPSWTAYTYPHPLLAGGTAPTISALTCSPTSVQAPGTTDCTVTASETPTSYAYSFSSCTAAGCTTSDTDSVATVSCSNGGPCTPCATATNASGTSAQYCGSAILVRYKKGSGLAAH